MDTASLKAGGILLGIGMGGFIDGILLHQIFQLHSMLSAQLPQDVLVNVKTSMVWDGLFHLLTWVTSIIGIVVLWRGSSEGHGYFTGGKLFAASLFGWGLFNFVEGIIDHYLLGIHHVVELQGLSIWDHLFVGSGVLFMILGGLGMKTNRRNRSAALA